MVVIDIQYVWCDRVDYFKLDAYDGCILAFVLMEVFWPCGGGVVLYG